MKTITLLLAALSLLPLASDAFAAVRKNGGELELYDITADPAESKNLAAPYPDIVKKLSAKVETWVATLPKEYIKTNDKD